METIEERERRELSTWWTQFDPGTCVVECFEHGCGALFFGRPRSMYCPDCLRQHHNRTQRRRRRRQRENAPPPAPKLATCSRCGVVFERQRQPRFCPDCRRELRNEAKRRTRAESGPRPRPPGKPPTKAQRKRRRANSRRHYERHKDTINEARRGNRREESQRTYAAMKADPERWAAFLERKRQWARAKTAERRELKESAAGQPKPGRRASVVPPTRGAVSGPAPRT
ncbi:MAG: hypothetical protein OXK82_02075 [Deltaproteobacteria bacterium]|nr:hypothetical protein [Deltaproteobacteria bacterium]